jgi:hypothetical protein
MAMITARQGKEISVCVLNDIGILAHLTRIVAEKGVNIRAATAWVGDGNKRIFRLVTDDNLRIADALRDHNYAPVEIDSIEVMLHHSPGMLCRICERLEKSGINIHYLYVGAPISNETCLAILSTDNDERALVLLNNENHRATASATH